MANIVIIINNTNITSISQVELVKLTAIINQKGRVGKILHINNDIMQSVTLRPYNQA